MASNKGSGIGSCPRIRAAGHQTLQHPDQPQWKNNIMRFRFSGPNRLDRHLHLRDPRVHGSRKTEQEES